VLALAARVAQRRDRGGRVAQQPVAKVRVDPGSCHDARSIARADARLVGIDQRIERGRIDVALLGEHRFQCPHAQVHVAQFAVFVLRPAHAGMLSQGLGRRHGPVGPIHVITASATKLLESGDLPDVPGVN
jgi:hypothetical protein